ncbi:type IV secretion system protein [Parasphingorhabdus sp.]|uniref:type IV secretion system protein n=1 Tax=Parasphingorhabdus sp. TaxID=2709688 RepID=UPI003BB1D835
MACNSISTGNAFLESTLFHIDCQAQTIGSLGFLGLSGPGSPYDALLTSLLTIFIALFGFRLLFGYDTQPRDAVTGILKIGIVLLLATSWPAYQILVYNTVLHGPAEVANVIAGAAQLPGANGTLVSRLQTVDSAILDLTALGSGRLQQVANSAAATNTVQFSQIAVGDDFALGFARIIYLAGTIGSLGLLRIAGGLLLALAPIFAGFLLFDATRGLFAGWLKGLALVALGSLGVTIALSVQLALLEPWLSSTLYLRIGDAAAPAAPSELLAINAAFLLVLFAIIALMARVAFSNISILNIKGKETNIPSVAKPVTRAEKASAAAGPTKQVSGASRAYQITQSVEASQRREAIGNRTGSSAPATNTASASRYGSGNSYPGSGLGSNYRRTTTRVSRAAAQRDRT